MPVENAINLLIVSRNFVFADSVKRALQFDESQFHFDISISPPQKNELNPHVEVADVTLFDSTCDKSEVELVRWLSGQSRVVVLAGLDPPNVVTEFIRAGAIGIAIRSESLDELLETIRSVAVGHHRCSARVLSIVVNQLRSRTKLSGNERIRA